jgi:hypothetical protein
MKPNQRVRGGGTWSDQARRITRTHENRLIRMRGQGTLGEQVSEVNDKKRAKLHQRRGGGTWSDQARQLDRERRRREKHGLMRWLLS